MLLFAALLLALAAVHAATENVVTLTTANFQETIDGNEFVLVEFYAPWCGHCKSLAPEYESAATKLKAENSNIVLAKVDATAETSISEGVTGFPTLKFYVSGKPQEYTGGRTSDTIIAWLKKKTGPAVQIVSTVDALEAIKKANPVVAVLVGSSVSAPFEAAARQLEIPFVLAEGAALKEALAVKEAEQVLVFKHFDELKAELETAAAATAEGIVAFVNTHALPLVVEFSQQTAQKIFGGAVKKHFILFVDKAADAAGVQALTKLASAVAAEQRGNYLFVTVDKADSRVVDFFGIKTYPDARIVELGETGMRKFKLVAGEEGITEDRLRKTCEAHATGKLDLDLKSEDVPANDMDGDVKVLVGKTFNSIVKQAGKDVFVEFYAPWCGHCKQLAPKYDELAAWAKTKPNLIVAKMDASQNEVAGVEVTSFPTLKLFKADSDEVVDYTEEREVPDMIAFLEKHASSCAAAAA